MPKVIHGKLIDNSEIMLEWDWTKNNIEGLNPMHLTECSSKLAWWKCNKAHSWQAVIYSRTTQKAGCPYCSGRLAISGVNDFATLYPKLLSEWDYEVNDSLGIRPECIPSSSNYKVGWVCPNNHKYMAVVCNRTRLSRSCPFCTGKRRIVGVNDLKTLYPVVAEEWDYTKNSEIDITTIAPTSGQVVWWTCHTCGYEYQLSVKNRTNQGNKYYCPVCSKQTIVSGINDFATLHPKLLVEWDTVKNNALGLDPTKLRPNAHVKVWWKCEYNHSWFTTIYSRSEKHNKCPYCSGRLAIAGETDIATLYPHMLEEWDFVKNDPLNLSPTELLPNSKQKVHWKCSKQHSWVASIQSRVVRGTGCPYCTNKYKIVGENNFAARFPHLQAEFCFERNRSLGINIDTIKGNDLVWWTCAAGHSWQATVGARAYQAEGCPYCAGKRPIDGETDVATLFPELVKEWDIAKNNAIGLSINEVTRGSHKKAWWLCEQGHSWQANIKSRTLRKTGCPYCAGLKVIVGETDLQTTHPHLLQEWVEELNTHIDLHSISAGSHQKAWWRCKTCGYEYQASVFNRTKVKATGCPACANSIVIVGKNDLATVYPDLVLEFDTERNEVLPTQLISKTTTKVWWKCTYCGNSWRAAVNDRARGLHAGCPKCNTAFKKSFPECALYYYLRQLNVEIFHNYKYDGNWEFDLYMPSLQVAVEYDGERWHKAKTADSDGKNRDDRKNLYCLQHNIKLIRIRELKCAPLIVDCICYSVDGTNHKYLTPIIKQVLQEQFNNTTIDVDVVRDEADIGALLLQTRKDNSIAMLYPNIAKEWHPEKNGVRTPDQVTPGNNIKAWWKCSVCHNDWTSTVYDRVHNARKCPYCKKMLSKYKGRCSKPKLKTIHEPSSRIRRIGLD